MTDTRDQELTPEVVNPMEDPKLRDVKKPALTIVIHSWATPIIGLLILLIGLVAGFFARPLIISEPKLPTAVAEASAGATPNAPDPQAIMELVVPKTRHFIGDDKAPVTIIEFSDFQ